MYGREALRLTIQAFTQKAYADATNISWNAIGPSLEEIEPPLSMLLDALVPNAARPPGVVLNALERGIEATSDLGALLYANAMCGQIERVRRTAQMGMPPPPDRVTEPLLTPTIDAIRPIAFAEITARTPAGAMMHYVQIAYIAVTDIIAVATQCAELWRTYAQGPAMGDPIVFYDYCDASVPPLSQRGISLRIAQLVLGGG